MKNSPFECGFLPKNVQRRAFSVQFYLISLIFLVFDVEVILLYPYLIGVDLLGSGSEFLFMLIILFGGLFLEWSQGSLEWLR